MTDQQILKKAIEKARKNGFNWSHDHCWKEDVEEQMDCDCGYGYFVIFSHDFAKAFWGENIDCDHSIWREGGAIYNICTCSICRTQANSRKELKKNESDY